MDSLPSWEAPKLKLNQWVLTIQTGWHNPSLKIKETKHPPSPFGRLSFSYWPCAETSGLYILSPYSLLNQAKPGSDTSTSSIWPFPLIKVNQWPRMAKSYYSSVLILLTSSYIVYSTKHLILLHLRHSILMGFPTLCLLARLSFSFITKPGGLDPRSPHLCNFSQPTL